MRNEKFTRDELMNMDPMHDSYANEILLNDKCLIVVYENLNKGVLDIYGQPFYKNKRLIIKYEFESFCDATLYYNKNKYEFIDMLENIKRFNKITKQCIFMSHRFLVDSFNELTLDFSIRKIVKGEYLSNKYWGLQIQLDVKEIEYSWE